MHLDLAFKLEAKVDKLVNASLTKKVQTQPSGQNVVPV